MGWGRDNPPGGPVTVGLPRTWCCGTRINEPHTPGCQFSPEGPIDYAGPVVVRTESVEPWHGAATQSGDPLRSVVRDPAPVDLHGQARYRAGQLAYEHFPVVEVAMLFGRDRPVVRITCRCGQFWSNEDGDDPSAVYTAWAQHLAETLVP